MIELDNLVAEYERTERNQADFEDNRFGEIYLDDQQGDFYE